MIMNTNQPPDREKELFEQAVEITSPQERAAFLNIACAGQPALRERLDNLLRAHDEAASKFLGDRPAAAPATIRLTVPDEEKLGTMIGRYKLLEKVGEGGFGSVYVAEQREPVKRRVALKVIKLGMDTKEVVARFEAERQALAMMDHPNIAKVLDAGATESGRPYFVMELVRGIRITDYCDQNQLPTLDRLKLFIQVCNAVQHAHQKGIIHRDLKPSNILVTLHDGVPVPKVIDFGIAKATQQELTDKTVYTQLQQFIGTPAYISPEQAEMSGLDIDTRADIYSLGVLLYELLTGQTPFDARELLKAGLDELRRTIREVEPMRPSTRLTLRLARSAGPGAPASSPALDGTARKASEDAGAPPSPRSRKEVQNLQHLITLVRGDIDWIVMKCLEKDRTRRYDTANGLAADVQRHLSNEPVIARPPSTLYRLQKMARRNKLAFAATTAVLTALVLGISVSAWQAVRASRESATARRAETAARCAETLAQTEARRADDEARRATTATTAARQSLAAADFYQATRLVDADNTSEALPFLARSLSLNPTNPAARTRLFTLLNYRTWMMPKLVLTNAGHTEHAAFSPDGARILTVSSNGEARLWDAWTEKPLTATMTCEPFPNFWSDELPFEFSADGKRLLTFHNNHVKVWDALSGRLLTELGDVLDRARQSGRITLAHFNPAGTRFVGVTKYCAQVWDAQNGNPIVGPFGDEAIESARYTSDGTKVLTISMTSHGRVWDAQTGQPLTALFARPDVAEIFWSPDGSRIAAAHGKPPRWDESKSEIEWYFSNDDSTARIWDAKTLQPLGSRMPFSYQYRSLNFSPDGSRIIADEDGSVWDAKSGEPVPALQPKNGWWATSFSRDGKRILAESIRSERRVLDAFSGQPVTESYPERGHAQSEVSPDGNRVMYLMEDGHLWMLDTRPATEPSRLFGEAQSIASARISPNGRLLATVTTNAVTLWDVESGTSSVLATEKSGKAKAEFSTDGEQLIVVSGAKTAQVWNVRTRQRLTPPRSFGAATKLLVVSPDGKWIATVTTNQILAVVNALTGEEVWNKVGRWYGAWFSPDSRWLSASGQTTNGATASGAFDTKTGDRKPISGQNGEVSRAPRFSPEGDHFLGGAGNSVEMYETHSGALLLRGLEAEKEIHNFAFGREGQQIITQSVQADGSANLRLWDANSGLLIADPFHEHRRNYPQTAGALTLDGRWLVTVSTNGQACLWNLSPPPGALPGWMADLLEALSGKVLNAHGVLEPTQRDPAQLLATLRTQSAAAPPTDEWGTWLRWFLADRATRGPYPLTP